MHTHTRTRTHACTHARTHARAHTRTHTHTHTHTHTRTHPPDEQRVLGNPLHGLEEEAGEREATGARVLHAPLLKLLELGVGGLALEEGAGVQLAAAPADVRLEAGNLVHQDISDVTHHGP